MPKGASSATARQRPGAVTFARLTPYLRGIIYGLRMADYGVQDIIKEVEKADGAPPSRSAVLRSLALSDRMGGLAWDGVVPSAGGRPKKTSDALDKAMLRLVFKHRGQAKVTCEFVQKKLRAARTVNKRTLQRRLVSAGLLWLARRRKSFVPSMYKASRISFSQWVVRRKAATLLRWAYSDGTVFYRARTLMEKEDGSRGGLGTRVWRAASGHDALFQDCVGPSAYWKGQGAPVRVWGLLVNGVLYISVLPIDKRMNKGLYAWMITSRFRGWVHKAFRSAGRVFLVQDHERALWAEEPLGAMRDAGFELLMNYPKCSQDLNAIETAWRELRWRLAQTEPIRMESRSEFVARLRQAVMWLNKHRAKYFRELCFSQKARARAVLEAKGARTKH